MEELINKKTKYAVSRQDGNGRPMVREAANAEEALLAALKAGKLNSVGTRRFQHFTLKNGKAMVCTFDYVRQTTLRAIEIG